MKMMLQLLCLLVGVGKVGLNTARAQQVTVASDGSAQFRTIQAALESLPNDAARPRTVYIKNGTYREKVSIDNKSKIILKGQSEKGVILTLALARDAWRCEAASNNDDWGVATLNLRNAPDITLENLTVVNPTVDPTFSFMTLDTEPKAKREDDDDIEVEEIPDEDED